MPSDLDNTHNLWTARISGNELRQVCLQRDMRLSNISLGAIIRNVEERTLVQFHYFATKSKAPVISTAVLCALIPQQTEQVVTNVVLEAHQEYAFEVTGRNDVFIAGNFIASPGDVARQEGGIEWGPISETHECTPTPQESRTSSLRSFPEADLFDINPCKTNESEEEKEERGDDNSGIMIKDVQPMGLANGNKGPRVRLGSQIDIWYAVFMKESAKLLARAWKVDGDPFRIVVGESDVPPVWEQSLLGMQAGGLRYIEVPPGLVHYEEWRSFVSFPGHLQRGLTILIQCCVESILPSDDPKREISTKRC